MSSNQELQEIFILRLVADQGQPQFNFTYQKDTGIEVVYEVTVQGVGHVSTKFPLQPNSVEEIIAWLAERLRS